MHPSGPISNSPAKRATGMNHKAALVVGLVFFFGNSLLLVRPKDDSNLRRLSSVSTPAAKYALAHRDSLGFFDDIDEVHWKLHLQRFRADSLFKEPLGEDPKNDNAMALWMFDNVDPMFTCPHAQRIGGRGDGPKWVCDPHRLRKVPDCLVYSVGSAGNYMFEDGLVDLMGDRHCEVHVFDPSTDFARPNDPETKNMCVIPS